MSDVSLNFVLAKFNNYYFFIPLSFMKTDFFSFGIIENMGGGSVERKKFSK